MRQITTAFAVLLASASAAFAAPGTAPGAAPAPLWWERGAATWYYKDDWKGQGLTGGRAFVKTIETPGGGAASGWIVVWGDSGYALTVNDRRVGTNVDGGLIDDYDLSAIVAGARAVTLRIEGGKVCAEGEIVGRDGRRYPFATGADWQDDQGRPPRAQPMAVGPSSGAFNRAHNGRLLTYNDEERGKTAIARTLARIQRFNDQTLFLLRRYRPAEEIVSFDPTSPWRVVEARAAELLPKARQILTSAAIPAQKAGDFLKARAEAQRAGALLLDVEDVAEAALAVYHAERRLTHVRNLVAILNLPATPGALPGAGAGGPLGDDLANLGRVTRSARASFNEGRWKWRRMYCEEAEALFRSVSQRLLASPQAAGHVGDGLGALDEFPEDRFAWLNAKELMGNDPSRWPFQVAPAECPYLDLTGYWRFRLDPDHVGETYGWHQPTDGQPWDTIRVPSPWEREGFVKDNPRSPRDCPYPLSDARTGDKPYNGYAWYRAEVFIPESLKGRQLVLNIGEVHNWARVFVNGQALGEGVQNPPSKWDVPAAAIRFGQTNTIAIEVYNHDNFGGIVGGRPALFAAGLEPTMVETPGPLSYVQEWMCPVPGKQSVRVTMLASAMSPGMVIATDASMLQLRDWEVKSPGPGELSRRGGEPEPNMIDLDAGLPVTVLEPTDAWVLLRRSDRAIFLLLERRPKVVRWDPVTAVLTITQDAGPVRVIVAPPLRLPALGAGMRRHARHWGDVLRRYPVSASEWVRAVPGQPATTARDCTLCYNYLDIPSHSRPLPRAIAPMPTLAQVALETGYPGVTRRVPMFGSYRAPYAEYNFADHPDGPTQDTITYRAPAVDRTKIMKGIGELFGKKTAAANMRGGLSERDMFRRWGEWGFDHVRYAWAFHADWDLPLVKHVGGPVLENNDAMWRRLDEFVDHANANHVQMMLCWFFNEDQPQRDTGGAVRNSTRYWQAHPEAQANAIELWRRIAARYASRPKNAVAYDFFNEPAYMNPEHWNRLMPELTRAIRAVDKEHLIVWEAADGWAQPQWCSWMKPSPDMLADPNILYSFHHYGKHWGYAYDEYYPSYKRNAENSQIDPWLEAILFSIRHHVPIHCGEFGLSMLQPEDSGARWLRDYLALFERFGIGWNWWNYSGADIYRTGLVAGERESPWVPILRENMAKSGWGKAGRP